MKITNNHNSNNEEILENFKEGHSEATAHLWQPQYWKSKLKYAFHFIQVTEETILTPYWNSRQLFVCSARCMYILGTNRPVFIICYS